MPTINKNIILSKKCIAYLLILIHITFLDLYCQENKPNINTYIDSASFDNIGYDNCNMKTNGECRVATYFINQGNNVFDVGANVGEWSKHVMSISSNLNIYAFEPIPGVFNQLKKNLPFEHISCFNLALSDKASKKTFVYYKKNNTTSRLSGFFRRPIVEEKLSVAPTSIQVDTEPLDSFVSTKNIASIDFLKIDTEGAELSILQGARNLLKNNQIKIIQFEYGGTYLDANTTLQEVYSLLSSYGYSIFRIIPNGIIHIRQWRDKLENYRYSNYLAITPWQALHN